MTMEGGGTAGGAWWPAGRNWRPYVRTERVTAITAAVISSPDPFTLAMRWAEITQVPYDLDTSGFPSLALENASLRFAPEDDGRGERLSGIDVRCSNRTEVFAAADRLGCRSGEHTIRAAGLDITCVD